ncbi:TetR/AcrR family transcriptional regulator [candidate division KSB1 bacterium]|nr:TetR/AcrR family transcriptional regulator [candidate division KSB1 bacterium]
MIDKKFQQIVRAATELFQRHGIRRITVEEICRNAMVSKMTFYKYFNNKTDLVKYIVNDLMDRAVDLYKNIIQSDLPFSEKAAEIFKMKISQSELWGEEFVKDFIHADPELEVVVQKRMAEISRLVYEDFRIAQDRGEIRKDIKLELILYLMNHLRELIQDQGIIQLYPNHIEMIRELITFFFYGIVEPSK